MKKVAIFPAIALLALMMSCGNSTNSEVEKEEVTTDAQAEKVEEGSFPPGYPQEITLPEGFEPRHVKEGEGTRVDSEGKVTYKTFSFDKMMPKNRAELITHYQKIVEEQQWDGQWRIIDEGETGSGTFKKDNMEMAIKVTDMLFTFTLSVF
jgi:hypothetical protein